MNCFADGIDMVIHTRTETVGQLVMPYGEVLMEHNSETATTLRTARAQLSRNIEDGIMWWRDVASYSCQRVAGKPSL